MGVCVFDPKQIAVCAKHAMASSDWSMGYENDRKHEPGLLFVHDEGVYCMSNGVPLQASASGEGCLVAYARGCDPKSGATFDEWYGNSRDLVGGDDFVEVLGVDDSFVRMCEESDEFHVEVTSESICAYFITRSKK